MAQGFLLSTKNILPVRYKACGAVTVVGIYVTNIETRCANCWAAIGTATCVGTVGNRSCSAIYNMLRLALVWFEWTKYIIV